MDAVLLMVCSFTSFVVGVVCCWIWRNNMTNGEMKVKAEDNQIVNCNMTYLGEPEDLLKKKRVTFEVTVKD